MTSGQAQRPPAKFAHRLAAGLLILAVGCRTAPSPTPAQPGARVEQQLGFERPAVEAPPIVVPCSEILERAALPNSSVTAQLDGLLGQLAVDSWTEAEPHQAAALCLLADFVAAKDPQATEAATLRTQAGLIAGAPELSLDQAVRLKQGVLAAATLLVRWQRERGTPSSEWAVMRAHDASTRLREDTPLGLQRAAVQDALRTLTTAFTLFR